MHCRAIYRLGLLALGIGAAPSAGRAQSPPELPPSLPGIRPASAADAVAVPSVGKPAALFDRYRNPEGLGEPTLRAARTARVGMDWLYRMQQANGMFLPGYNPALNRPLDDGDLLRQATAAFGLAHAARATGEARYAARASQVILALLAETKPAGGMRVPNDSPAIPSKLAFAGMLVRAIGALPEPALDLQARAEELAQYIRAQQRPDGSLPDDVGAAGLALYGLAGSQRTNPSDAKAAALRNAAAYYRAAFRSKPSPALIGWMGPAFAEAFQLTRETAFAEVAFEMNDWLCALQYDRIDPATAAYRGGFRWGTDAKSLEVVPTLDGALAVLGLAEAYQSLPLLQKPAAARAEKYRAALGRAVPFLADLQYGEENVQHFAPGMRAFLTGAFHQSPADGDVRSDRSALACVALAHFLASGADR